MNSINPYTSSGYSLTTNDDPERRLLKAKTRTAEEEAKVPLISNPFTEAGDRPSVPVVNRVLRNVNGTFASIFDQTTEDVKGTSAPDKK